MDKEILTQEEKEIKELREVLTQVSAEKEQEQVSKELLALKEVEQIKALMTNPSGEAKTETKKDVGTSLGRLKKNPKDLFSLYLTNQFVARAINIRAESLVSRGYKIIGDNAEGVKACEELIDASGGSNLFIQLSINTDISGDGFLEKVYNSSMNKILKLKHVHPVTFGFKKDSESGMILIGPNKEPVGYSQFVVDKNGMETQVDVPLERIAHLRYNSLGDDFTGLSVIQSGYNTIVRLMNMEYSAAEAAVKTANPVWVFRCASKSPQQVALWAQILSKMSGRDQLFIPEGMEIELKSPGNQNFNEYSTYFIDAVVSTFGVPRLILLGDSSSGNRAEAVVLSRHFYAMIRSNQNYMQDFFNEVFKEYGEIAGFIPPKLVFADVSEDTILTAKSAIELFTSGVISQLEARKMIGMSLTPDGETGEVNKGKVQPISEDIKRQKRATQFPQEPGVSQGSQVGRKAKMVTDPNSEFGGD